jgi:hypothetical protein
LHQHKLLVQAQDPFDGRLDLVQVGRAACEKDRLALARNLVE